MEIHPAFKSRFKLITLAALFFSAPFSHAACTLQTLDLFCLPMTYENKKQQSNFRLDIRGLLKTPFERRRRLKNRFSVKLLE